MGVGGSVDRGVLPPNPLDASTGFIAPMQSTALVINLLSRKNILLLCVIVRYSLILFKHPRLCFL